MKEFLIDPRFSYSKRAEDRANGASVCRNIGLEIASGDYIQFLDSDDVLAPNKFEVQIKALENASSDAIATCKWGGFRLKAEEGKIYQDLDTYLSTSHPEKLLRVYGSRLTFLPPHVFLIPAFLIRKAGKWMESLTVNDDGEFFSRLILKSSEIIFCKETHVFYRSGAGNRLSGEINTDHGMASYIYGFNSCNQSCIL